MTKLSMIAVTMRTALVSALLAVPESQAADRGRPNALPAVDPGQAFSVRVQAAIALGRSRGIAAAPALVVLLKDGDKDVRREAAKALGQIKALQAVPALTQSLRDSDKNVRFYAAYALGEIKDPSAAGALLESLGDPEWCVRDQAAWALREIRDPAMLAPLAAMLRQPQADTDHIGWIVQQLASDSAIRALSGLLNGPDPIPRKRAMGILVALGDKATFEPLVAALKDADPEVRRMAVEGLARLADKRAERPLSELAARESNALVVAAVKSALRRWSGEENLAAHWSFDDKDAKVARDVTGRGTDGTIREATPVEGKVGYALKFGKGACVELGRPNRLPIAGQPFTIMAWIKSEADRGVVVARGGAACGFSLYVKDGVPKFAIRRSQDEPAEIAAGKESVVGLWTHLAGVVREDCVELFVNGRLAATAKTGGCVPGNCGQGMEIGWDKANSPAEITDHFQGIIDEVQQFSAALGGEQIARQCRVK